MTVNLRKAEIVFKDELAGTLEETANGGTRFIYGPQWSTPIGCCLPILQREHEWRQGLHPFFEQLGPEGWLREKQARVAHIPEEDDFGLLLRYGGDCIGAVGVRPPKDAAGKVAAPVAEVTASPGRTLSGIQRKLLVTKEAQDRYTPAGAQGLAPYIAKFDSETDRTQNLVRNESLSLSYAAALLGREEITEFDLGTVSVLNEPALIVTRFDRKADGTKLRLEDFTQILCKPRGRDFTGKYNAGYEDVAEVVKEHSARPEIDNARFFRRLIVFILIGNCDAHLKNFSLLETDANLRLSPIYDVVNTALYDTFDQEIALSINGKKPNLDQVTAKLLRDFGLAIGLPQRAVDQAFEDLRTRAKRAAPIIAPPRGEPPEGFVHRYSEIVNRACLRILGK